MGFLAKRRERREQEWQEVAGAARDDMLGLGDQIRELDVDISLAKGQEPRDDYQRALDCYDRANAAFTHAESTKQPGDFSPMSSALEEGRWAMVCCRARLDGSEPPERKPPCFFDPRHGPSLQEVRWAPPAGKPRDVPACGACATRVTEGFEPEPRTVVVRGRPVVYWNAPPIYYGYATGYYDGYAGMGAFGGLGLAGGFDDGAWGDSGDRDSGDGWSGDDSSSDGGWGGDDSSSSGGGWGGDDSSTSGGGWDASSSFGSGGDSGSDSFS
jgi:hypothetical protein